MSRDRFDHWDGRDTADDYRYFDGRGYLHINDIPTRAELAREEYFQ